MSNQDLDPYSLMSGSGIDVLKAEYILKCILKELCPVSNYEISPKIRGHSEFAEFGSLDEVGDFMDTFIPQFAEDQNLNLL